MDGSGGCPGWRTHPVCRDRLRNTGDPRSAPAATGIPNVAEWSGRRSVYSRHPLPGVDAMSKLRFTSLAPLEGQSQLSIQWERPCTATVQLRRTSAASADRLGSCTSGGWIGGGALACPRAPQRSIQGPDLSSTEGRFPDLPEARCASRNSLEAQVRKLRRD